MGAEPGAGATSLWLTTDPGGGRWLVREGAVSTVELHQVRNLYCATKPMVAMGVLALLERHGVDWTTARVDAQGRLDDSGPWAVTDLLDRRTSFSRPTVWEVLQLPMGRAEPELAACAERAATAPAGPPGHSEVLVWYVLSELAARLDGEGWAGALQADLRAAVGSRLWLLPDRELLDLPVEAMAILTAEHRGAEVPLLHDLTVRTRALTSPYFGGFGSFAAVISWFAALGRHLRGDPGHGSRFPDARRLRVHLGAATDAFRSPCAVLGFQAVEAADRLLRLAVQAAGGALSVELEPFSGVVTAVLGSRFLADPRRRRPWLAGELAGARAWAEQVPA